jgi:chromosomal replication initiation ATPase DnaA
VTPRDEYDEDAARAADQAEVRAAKAAAAVAGWLGRMPARYADRPGRVFRCDPRVAEWTRGLVAGTPDMPTLWLAGGTGTGKTEHVWRGIGEAAYRAGWDGSIGVITGAQFFEVAAPPTDYGELRALGRADVLVLDDIDSAGITDWVRQHLYLVIHERWEQARPTVVTSNSGELADMVGPRIASRLNPVRRVPVSGPDHRRDGGPR